MCFVPLLRAIKTRIDPGWSKILSFKLHWAFTIDWIFLDMWVLGRSINRLPFIWPYIVDKFIVLWWYWVDVDYHCTLSALSEFWILSSSLVNSQQILNLRPASNLEPLFTYLHWSCTNVTQLLDKEFKYKFWPHIRRNVFNQNKHLQRSFYLKRCIFNNQHIFLEYLEAIYLADKQRHAKMKTLLRTL